MAGQRGVQRGQARALGVAGHRPALDAGQVVGRARRGTAPAPAGAPARPRCRRSESVLRSRLWRTNRLVSPMMNSGVCRNRSSERATTPSVRVLDRHDAEVGRARRWCVRNTSSMLAQGTRSIDEPKKPSAASSLKVPAGPEVGHARGRLQRAAGRHDLAPDRRHAVAPAAGPALTRLQAVDDLRLAFGPEDHRALALLDLADLRAPAWRGGSAARAARDRRRRSACAAPAARRRAAPLGRRRAGQLVPLAHGAAAWRRPSDRRPRQRSVAVATPRRLPLLVQRLQLGLDGGRASATSFCVRLFSISPLTC